MDDDEARVKLLDPADLARAVRPVGPGPLAVGAALLLAACLHGESGRPLGGPCTSDSTCESGLRCAYGRCRAECSFERDCPGDAVCVEAPGGGFGVCTLVDEQGCDPDADVSACEDGFACVSGGCAEVVGAGDADADVPADADADAVADAEPDVEADDETDGANCSPVVEICGNCEDEDCDGVAETCDGTTLVASDLSPAVDEFVVFAVTSEACYGCVSLICVGPETRILASLTAPECGAPWSLLALLPVAGTWRCSLLGDDVLQDCESGVSPPRACLVLEVR